MALDLNPSVTLEIRLHSLGVGRMNERTLRVSCAPGADLADILREVARRENILDAAYEMVVGSEPSGEVADASDLGTVQEHLDDSGDGIEIWSTRDDPVNGLYQDVKGELGAIKQRARGFEALYYAADRLHSDQVAAHLASIDARQAYSSVCGSTTLVDILTCVIRRSGSDDEKARRLEIVKLIAAKPGIDLSETATQWHRNAPQVSVHCGRIAELEALLDAGA